MCLYLILCYVGCLNFPCFLTGLRGLSLEGSPVKTKARKALTTLTFPVPFITTSPVPFISRSMWFFFQPVCCCGYTCRSLFCCLLLSSRFSSRWVLPFLSLFNWFCIVSDNLKNIKIFVFSSCLQITEGWNAASCSWNERIAQPPLFIKAVFSSFSFFLWEKLPEFPYQM